MGTGTGCGFAPETAAAICSAYTAEKRIWVPAVRSRSRSRSRAAGCRFGTGTTGLTRRRADGSAAATAVGGAAHLGPLTPPYPERVARHPFAAVNLISDPIHGYVELTKRLARDESAAAGLPDEDAAEDDLLDTAWLQRLRRISQLQSARWVFPTAEHSRFTHGLGVMHEAGLWARSLLPSLRTALPALAPGEPLPSEGLVVETLRVAGLLHDVGHGPFAHFFDDRVLILEYLTSRQKLTHIFIDCLFRSTSTMSASAPTLSTPFLGKRPKALADSRNKPDAARQSDSPPSDGLRP